MGDRQWSHQLILTTAVACLASVQYGYHMSELNGPGGVLTCQISNPVPGKPYEDSFFHRQGRVQCLGMSDEQLGIATSIFSIGGLVSSFYAGTLAQLIGRKKATIFNGIIFIIGSFIETIANDNLGLCIGRFVSGLGAGSGIVVTPLLINEISPHGLKGFLGSMNQVAINLGILLTQVLAIRWANDIEWRWLLFVGAVIGALNVVAVFFIDESPKWLSSKGRIDEARKVIIRLRGNNATVDEEIRLFNGSGSSEPLLSGNDPSQQKANATLLQYVRDPHFKNSLIVVTAILSGQQFCGINSIIFYGVNTIRKLVPKHAVLINCLISLENAVITFLAAPFVDEYGRVPCLLTSVSIMGGCSILMSIGILREIPSVSVIATFAYVASFAIGLGPIPFLMIPEVTQVEARGAAQSYGTVVNWISTFMVGFLFPIINSWIGGYVYLIFAVICGLFVLFIKTEVPETKGRHTYEEVWNLRVD